LLRGLVRGAIGSERVVAGTGRGLAWPVRLGAHVVRRAAAGRAFAAYGGIYILCAISWMMLVEKVPATRSDGLGVLLCLAGCIIILIGRR
jgi:drug/metabolite transporter superfamily protein YnfA